MPVIPRRQSARAVSYTVTFIRKRDGNVNGNLATMSAPM